MLSIKLTGLDQLKVNLRKMHSDTRIATEKAIGERTQKLQSNIYASMSGGGRSRYKTVFREGRGNASSPGTGLEVPAKRLLPGQIGVDTGRMRANLQTGVTLTRDRVTGGVGYSSEFSLRGKTGKAGGNGIKWPEQENPPMLIVGTRRAFDKSFKKEVRSNSEPPTKYVPDVLLGNDKIIGRNVLRVAIYEDIQNNDTINSIKTNVEQKLFRIKMSNR